MTAHRNTHNSPTSIPKLFSTLSLLLLVVLSLATYAEEATENTQKIVTAQTAIRTVTLTGFSRPKAVLPLAFEASGKVQNIYADIGEYLPKSGLLACLDETFIRLDLKANRAEQKRLQIEIDYAAKEVRRYEELVSKFTSPRAQLDEVQNRLDVARQQLSTLKVQQQRLEEQKKRYCIGMNSTWQILERSIEKGQWVTMGQSVAKLGDFSQVLIPLALSWDEYQALLVQISDTEVMFPEMGQGYPAKLTHISPDFDESSRKFTLDLQVDNRKGTLRGGLRAEFPLQLQEREGIVLISESAVKERYEEFWLQPETGEKMRVTFLGFAEQKAVNGERLMRISSPNVKVGNRFLIQSSKATPAQATEAKADTDKDNQ